MGTENFLMSILLKITLLGSTYFMDSRTPQPCIITTYFMDSRTPQPYIITNFTRWALLEKQPVLQLFQHF
jgi:hypothetical protein